MKQAAEYVKPYPISVLGDKPGVTSDDLATSLGVTRTRIFQAINQIGLDNLKHSWVSEVHPVTDRRTVYMDVTCLIDFLENVPFQDAPEYLRFLRALDPGSPKDLTPSAQQRVIADQRAEIEALRAELAKRPPAPEPVSFVPIEASPGLAMLMNKADELQRLLEAIKAKIDECLKHIKI